MFWMFALGSSATNAVGLATGSCPLRSESDLRVAWRPK